MSSKIQIIIKRDDNEKFIQDVVKALMGEHDGYLFLTHEKDKYSKSLIHKMSQLLDGAPECVMITPKKLFQFPDRMTGVMINLRNVGGILPNPTLKYDCEADFLLRVALTGKVLLLQDENYEQADIGDGNFKEFPGVYEREWYIDAFDNFLIPFLEEYYIENPEEKQLGRSNTEILTSRRRYGLPELLQFFALYYIKARFDANLDNRNRHVLSDEDKDIFDMKLRLALKYIDDKVIMNLVQYPVYAKEFAFRRMLLRIKYGGTEFVDLQLEERESITYDEYLMGMRLAESASSNSLRSIFEGNLTIPAPKKSGLCVTFQNYDLYSSDDLKVNVRLMEIHDGSLEIDASVPDIFDRERCHYLCKCDDKSYPVVMNEAYSVTKYFGVPSYKRYTFHVSIPLGQMEAKKSKRITFALEYQGKEHELSIEYQSHFSKLANYPKKSYWHHGEYLLKNEYSPRFDTDEEVREEDKKNLKTAAILVEKYSWGKMAGMELGIWGSLIGSLSKHRLNFFLLRFAWVMTHPFFAKKDIWLFFDKIYKGGDSSEYLYRYVVEHNKDIKAYYLLDSKTPDYKRMLDDGLKPLKRGSFKHRLVFLNANMVIVSNSTVYAFNDYYLENSRYIRGITDFDTVCVQHGLSVQKIAVAQQRLRDNTKLYFCASKYEIENLSHPAYDYQGYDALKLTGVPRYDGLHNRDQKKILISPTWRMQAAHLVTKNEGVERDYNPEFKNTPYFKVYNTLINDERLIKAAEQYGYRLTYVLHPIVSPQKKDFTANKYVDIVPAVGDMSYEKEFCESSLMVTDYSGIQFDFAYMRKPLVYYHPEELEAHYDEGTYHYDTMAFGEIVKKKDELVDLLIDYMANGCQMKEKFVERANDFYEFDDDHNCERIYNELIKFKANKKL